MMDRPLGEGHTTACSPDCLNDHRVFTPPPITLADTIRNTRVGEAIIWPPVDADGHTTACPLNCVTIHGSYVGPFPGLEPETITLDATWHDAAAGLDVRRNYEPDDGDIAAINVTVCGPALVDPSPDLLRALGNLGHALGVLDALAHRDDEMVAPWGREEPCAECGEPIMPMEAVRARPPGIAHAGTVWIHAKHRETSERPTDYCVICGLPIVEGYISWIADPRTHAAKQSGVSGFIHSGHRDTGEKLYGRFCPDCGNPVDYNRVLWPDGPPEPLRHYH